MVFTNFRIYKTFRAFKTTFLKLKKTSNWLTHQILPWTVFLSHKDLNLSDEAKLDFSCLKYLPYEVNS